jgi:serine/threonine protein kinase
MAGYVAVSQLAHSEAPSIQISFLELQRAWGGHDALPLSFSLRVVLEVMRELELLHARGEVHGELTSAHIILAEDCHVRLVPPSRTALRPGTQAASFPLHYLAPERLRGAAGDLRADVFSLGVLLWETLAGQPLVEAFSVKDVLLRWRIEPQPECRVRSPQLWAQSLAHIAARAFALEPGARYPDVRPLHTAVELLGGRHAAKQEPWNALLRWPLSRPRPRLLAHRDALPTLALHGARSDDQDTFFDLNAVPSEQDSDAEPPISSHYIGFASSSLHDELPTRVMTKARPAVPRVATPSRRPASQTQRNPEAAVAAPTPHATSLVAPAAAPAPSARGVIVFVIAFAALVGSAVSFFTTGPVRTPDPQTAPARALTQAPR